jgi:hypothetical protein
MSYIYRRNQLRKEILFAVVRCITLPRTCRSVRFVDLHYSYDNNVSSVYRTNNCCNLPSIGAISIPINDLAFLTTMQLMKSHSYVSSLLCVCSETASSFVPRQVVHEKLITLSQNSQGYTEYHSFRCVARQSKTCCFSMFVLSLSLHRFLLERVGFH